MVSLTRVAILQQCDYIGANVSSNSGVKINNIVKCSLASTHGHNHNEVVE